jgi:tRNA uridine 5-carboxymethylaminomethyl modification enzyme
MGARTLLLTMNLDTIGKMSCNPAIGGVAKGHMVREIDALGGLMGQVTEVTGIQFRMLNRTKGPAVWAPRAQADKALYPLEMKRRLEATEGLELKQGTIEELIVENGRICGVRTKEGICYLCHSLIITSGTFLRGLLHIGEANLKGGRAGDQPSVGLSASLEKLGFTLKRQKTGTPPRVHRRSIDFDLCEEQPGEEDVRFSYDPPCRPRLEQVSCWITHTTADTKQIIQENIHRSPMYSGKIEGIGPRYCPSIEDKVMRFKDKERHQLFLEPEGLGTDEFYVNGISSSLPLDVQYAFLRSIPALRNAEIMRPAYAIEYDYVASGQIHPTLESRRVAGLYFAGQINGTSGYEEAAGQGLLAGINAVRKNRAEPPFILRRSEAYIGVMIDDLCTKEIDEPYRMFTSRAEHRLLLRQDNADLRLRRYGYELGIVDAERYQRHCEKEASIERTTSHLSKTFKHEGSRGYSLAQLLARPENTYAKLKEAYPEEMPDLDTDSSQQVELSIKYAGYIQRQLAEVDKLNAVEDKKIPSELDYSSITGLRKEAQEKLQAHLPNTIGQAVRIAGVSPADIQILMVAIERFSRERPAAQSVRGT